MSARTKAVVSLVLAICVSLFSLLPILHADDIEVFRPISPSLANNWTGLQTQSGGVIQSGLVQGNFTTKSLTSGAAVVAFVQIATGAGMGTATVEFDNEVANSSNNLQAIGGTVSFNWVVKAGAITCTVGTEVLGSALAETAGGSTLTRTYACVDAGSNNLQLKVNDTSSLTSILGNTFRYRVRILSSQTVTATAQ